MTEIERLQAQTGAALVLVAILFKMNPQLSAATREAMKDLRGMLLPFPMTDDQIEAMSQTIAKALAPVQPAQ